MTAPAKVLNVRLSAEVKAKLTADADDQGASVNDVGVGILADYFHISFKGTGRRSPGTHTMEGPILLRVPPRIYAKVHAAALGKSKTEVVESIFRERYELAALVA